MQERVRKGEGNKSPNWPFSYVDPAKIQHYLEKTHECDLLADFADDRLIKYTFEDLAQQWHDLAEQAKTLANDE